MVGIKWNHLCTWILNLIILNILWTITVVLGFVFIGFGPANYALSSTIRHWIKEQQSNQPLKLYVKYLKENVKENIISGILIIMFILIVTTDLLFVNNWFLRIVILIAIVVFSPIILLFYPVSAHFNVSNIKEKIYLVYQLFLRYVLLFMLMLIMIIIYSLIMLRWLPAYFVLFGVASIHYIMAVFLKNIYIKEKVWEFQDKEGED